jgi:hypothetical protein
MHLTAEGIVAIAAALLFVISVLAAYRLWDLWTAQNILTDQWRTDLNVFSGGALLSHERGARGSLDERLRQRIGHPPKALIVSMESRACRTNCSSISGAQPSAPMAASPSALPS